MKNHVKTCNDRMKNFFNIENTHKLENYKEDDFIFLRTIFITQSSVIDLKYHIESEKILAIKHFNISENEKEKLNNREHSNYECIQHPFIPKFYGILKNDDGVSLVMEYINGKTLDKINLEELIFEQKLMIIIEILYTFQYLHRNKYIYRDLKPNNLIIDQNNKPVLIDFDRMIKYNKNDESLFTADLNSPFLAPELKFENNIPLFESDIYSIGRIIYYIFTGELENFSIDKLQQNNPAIYDMVNRCCAENPKLRPSIIGLIRFFDTYILSIANASLIQNIEKNISLLVISDYYSRYNVDRYELEVINFICFAYYEGKYITQDVNKCAYFLSLGVYQKSLYSQYIIGFIYNDGIYINDDENKFFHYMKLSADQNHPFAQTMIGIWYQGNENIDKCLEYFTLAANQNHPYALICLGYLYMIDEDIQQNLNKSRYYYEQAEKYYANRFTAFLFAKFCWDSGMFPEDYKEKAIHYYILAAEQNDALAQNELGDIYFDGFDVPQDINIGMRYYSLAAKQNYVESIITLGDIYFEGINIPQNINKAFYYYKIAADQNDLYAIKKIADIYYDGKYVHRNINKAIQYYSLAADQNDLNSIKKLADIYYGGVYVPRNIDKACYYYLLHEYLNDYNLLKPIDIICKKNNINAIKMLANSYFEGKNVPQNINKAIQYYSLAADKNDIGANKILADIYFNGKYIPQNINKAIQYYLLSADHNSPSVLYKIGTLYYRGKYVARNMIRAIHYFTLAADKNYIISQFILGVIYYEGHYAKFNINKSIHYFTLAADQNHVRSQFILGSIYYEGKYLTRDINKAIYYFTLAANQNDINSQYILGVIYYEGKYVTHNIQKSIHYFSLAENRDHSLSKNILSFMYNENKYHKYDIDEIISYFTKFAKRNDQFAQYYLGVIYYEGKYVKHDIDKAILYLTQSAKQNNSDAQNNLGYIYYEGKYVKRDIDLAIKYFLSAVKQKNPIAENNFGYIYYEDKYIKYDTYNLVYYLRSSANKNYPIAQYNLGSIFFEGQKVVQDNDQAIHFLSLAADQGFPKAQYELGFIYYLMHDLKKSFKYMSMASLNNIQPAKLFISDVYFEGIYIKRDIKKAFHLYKNLSSFNNQYAKNNLGVIYKNGYGVVSPNNNYAKIYFNEAIQCKNDCLSMFNLANILLEEEDALGQEHDESIKLLIDSSNQGLIQSHLLLCLLLFKKHKCINLQIIQDELKKHDKESYELSLKIYQTYSDLPSTDVITQIFNSKNLIYIHYKVTQLKFDEQSDYLLSQEDDLLDENHQLLEGFGYDLL